MNFIVKLSGLILFFLLLSVSPGLYAANSETRQDIENLLRTENLSKVQPVRIGRNSGNKGNPQG